MNQKSPFDPPVRNTDPLGRGKRAKGLNYRETAEAFEIDLPDSWGRR